LFLKSGAKLVFFIEKKPNVSMNFLAHLLLTHTNEDWMIGNMIADFISNRDLQDLKPEVREGVMIHRKIDTFTDTHDSVRESIKRLHPIFHKYSPVVVDIYYDYFLSKNWRRYSPLPMEDFSLKIYDTFNSRMEEVPDMMKPRLKSMISHNFLENYATKTGIQFTFNKFQERVKFPVSFEQASDIMMVYEDEFNDEFNTFFPEIKKYINAL
jgi:acyl carrier protein phosphodiesterase